MALGRRQPELGQRAPEALDQHRAARLIAAQQPGAALAGRQREHGELAPHELRARQVELEHAAIDLDHEALGRVGEDATGGQ